MTLQSESNQIKQHYKNLLMSQPDKQKIAETTFKLNK